MCVHVRISFSVGFLGSASGSSVAAFNGGGGVLIVTKGEVDIV